MQKNIQHIQCDFYEHPELSRSVLDLIAEELKKIKDDKADYCAIPSMNKPYFWQFNKRKKYKEECKKILNNVKNIINE